MRKILLLAAVATFGAGAANAMTMVTSVNGPDMGPTGNQHVVDDFSTSAGLSGTYSLATGSTSGVTAAPLGDTTQYLSVGGGQAATLTLARPLEALSFYWGSIDKYNTVSFFSGANKIASFTGGDVPPAPANGSQGNALNNRRVNFDFGGAKVSSVQFSSAQNAFELDTVAGSVPEPAAWALFLVGFGMIGVSVRRRNAMVVSA